MHVPRLEPDFSHFHGTGQPQRTADHGRGIAFYAGMSPLAEIRLSSLARTVFQGWQGGMTGAKRRRRLNRVAGSESPTSVSVSVSFGEAAARGRKGLIADQHQFTPPAERTGIGAGGVPHQTPK